MNLSTTHYCRLRGLRAYCGTCNNEKALRVFWAWTASARVRKRSSSFSMNGAAIQHAEGVGNEARGHL